jgi:hypothetical protein
MIKLHDIINEDLRRWVKEKWLDQNGRPCGNSKTKGVKKCRPSRKVSDDTPKTWSSFDKKEKDSLVAQKRKVGMGKRTPKAESIVDEEKTPKRDACYYKVKARYTKDGGTWPSAYGSLALSKCRKQGAKNWGNKSKNNENIQNKDYMKETTICDGCALELMRDIKEGKVSTLHEAEYQGRKVQLGKPTRGDVKKFKVYVRNAEGNVVKVNFGHGGTSAKRAGQKTMSIKKNNPARRKSFRARHNCDNPGPRTKARYWSCRNW